ncbi:amino acid adenylation domain-containing protein [Streptomyces sp. NPDC015492]|uniref:non-ribosomal peptide synthetase n=1 Tax=Streptomyces sp. NPDC015492 TaxID=3364958 RepID=UPI0036FD8837
MRPTPAQVKLATHYQFFPADASFNNALVFKMHAEVDTERLKTALTRIGREIRALNTTFPTKEGAVAAEEILDVTEFIVNEIAISGGHDHISRIIGRDIDTPICPDTWPQVDFRIYRAEDGLYLSIILSHLVVDVYSYFNFIRVLEALYANTECEIPSADIDPGELSRPGQSSEDAFDFFSDHLSHLRSLSNNLCSARSMSGALAGQRTRMELGESLSMAVRSTLADLSCSPFVFFLAIHTLILAQLAGKRNVIVGVPLANRRGKAHFQAFGHYVNTLPLAVDLSKHQTLTQLCKALSVTTLGMVRHQDFDLSSKMREVCPDVPPGILMLDNVVTYYKEPLQLRLGGIEVERVPLRRTLVKYPLSTTVEDLGREFAVEIESSRTLQNVDLPHMIEVLIRQLTSNPLTPLEELDLFLPERGEGIDHGRNTAEFLPDGLEEFDVPDSLMLWFEQVVRCNGDRVSLSAPEGALTYAELNKRANRVARELKHRTTGQYIGVSLHPSLDLIAVLLGILKAGKTYVPLAPESPASRIRHIMDHFTEPMTVITDEARWTNDEASVIMATALIGADQPDHDLDTLDLRDQPAYIIFTSGSTGKPKGVEVTHRNVMRLFRATEDLYDFGSEDIWCLFHSYAFDFSVWEIFGCLLYGGQLAVVPDRTIRSSAQFLHFIIENKVTVLNQTPSAFRQLLRVLEPRHKNQLALRYVIFGGEALPFYATDEWYAVMGDRTRLINMYGITETTVHATYFELTQSTAKNEKTSVIGRPLSDLSIVVADDQLRHCPMGVTGEILISGSGVTAGYFQQPELTKQRFIQLPGSERVFYRSGDLAYVREDGNLVYIGRMDRQVQVRGFRIELGEVEAALSRVPGIRESAVRVDDRDPENPQLIAYYVGEFTDRESAIRSLMKELIPSYMVPTHFLHMEMMPLTVNGKIEYSALPWPEMLPEGHSVRPDVGLSGMELAVHTAWQQTLPGRAIGLDDNFFDIGGTSLKVVELHHSLQEKVNLEEFEMIDLFSYTTVRALAAYLTTLM